MKSLYHGDQIDTANDPARKRTLSSTWNRRRKHVALANAQSSNHDKYLSVQCFQGWSYRQLSRYSILRACLISIWSDRVEQDQADDTGSLVFDWWDLRQWRELSFDCRLITSSPVEIFVYLFRNIFLISEESLAQLQSFWPLVKYYLLLEQSDHFLFGILSRSRPACNTNRLISIISTMFRFFFFHCIVFLSLSYSCLRMCWKIIDTICLCSRITFQININW